MRVEVVPYDHRWPAWFDAIRSELSAALEDVKLVGIEHVGSTSVPGLPAKSVIDVDVVVTADQLNAAIAALTAAGYTYEGELGIPDRHAFRAPPGGARRHVYVVLEGSLALRNHLAVRDVLRADPILRDEYGALKLALSTRDYPDVGAYVADKSEVLDRVLRRAGFNVDELRAVDDVNRQG